MAFYCSLSSLAPSSSSFCRLAAAAASSSSSSFCSWSLSAKSSSSSFCRLSAAAPSSSSFCRLLSTASSSFCSLSRPPPLFSVCHRYWPAEPVPRGEDDKELTEVAPLPSLFAVVVSATSFFATVSFAVCQRSSPPCPTHV